MNIPTTLRERFLFLQKFLQAPRRTGSIIPSSRFLTREIMGQVDWPRCETIAELGAGTGVFTRGIAHHRMPATKVLVFERDDILRERLADEFPHFTMCPDAMLFSKALAENGVTSLDCVISGLPFSNFPRDARATIFEQINASLKPDGLFILFQYSLMLRKHLHEHFRFVSSKLVRFNLPPAYVLVFQKK